MDRMFVIVVLALGLIGAALIGGGIIAYRVSDRAGTRVAAGASIGAGVAISASILFLTPTSVSQGA